METALTIPDATTDILDSIEKEREREIVTRRFGLHGRRQTLEEIGAQLGITRERVRQIEKHVIQRLSSVQLPHLEQIETTLKQALEELGRVAPLHDLTAHLKLEHEHAPAHLNFLASLAPGLTVINDNDHFHQSVAITEHHDHSRLHELLEELVGAIKSLGKPATIPEIKAAMATELDDHHVKGLARSAKQVTNLDDKWGLTSWPAVNPKSIRDKIAVILQKQGKPMHFSEIATAIKESDFKRRDVTTQAIHNELIKDNRFILVGRGIYALSEWGYNKGTVADIIADILAKESPLHRDEIVERVLKQRYVKPTTIILNLQGKPQFKRVAKATYALA